MAALRFLWRARAPVGARSLAGSVRTCIIVQEREPTTARRQPSLKLGSVRSVTFRRLGSVRSARSPDPDWVRFVLSLSPDWVRFVLSLSPDWVRFVLSLFGSAPRQARVPTLPWRAPPGEGKAALAAL